jgi:hypothetical protein
LQGAKEKLREKGFEVFAEPQKHEKAEVIEKLLRMKEELKKIKEKL